MVKRAILEPGVYLYVGPEKSQAKNIIWKDPQGLFKFLPPEVVKKKNEVELTVYFKQTLPKTPGSVFYIEGADNIDRMRGLKPRGIILDEYAQIKPELWTEVLFPAINQSGGWVIFIGTFKGKNHFYDLFSKYYDWEKGEAIENTDYRCFYLPYYQNPFFTEDQIRAAKETMPPAQFEQEYGCLPLSGTSNVFPSLADLMSGSLEDKSPNHSNHLFSMGVDLAKYQDYTAVSIICRNCHSLVLQESWQAEWTVTLEKLVQLQKYWNKAHVTIDSTGVGDPISELLKKRGISGTQLEDFKFSNASKDRLIKKLGVYFSEKKLKLPPMDQIPTLHTELEQFTYEILPSGKIRYTAPQGKHDDEVYSLALSVWYLKDNPTTDLYSTHQPVYAAPSLDPFESTNAPALI
ncbi:MAG: terminase large subunit [Acidobacteriota bacterium]|nr:terminase large subunit [Acidobacteriota bacterium]